MQHSVRSRWILGVLLTGQVIANIDIAIVNVATPAMHRDLHASGGWLELIVSGYVLAFAMLIVTGARLGRIHGYQRVFLAGLAGFTLASLGCALAPDTGFLVAMRVAQGAAAALMVPQVLTGIQLNFTGAARDRALGGLVLALSGGAVAGQALGGLLVSADVFGLTWRPIFFINVPLGLATLVVGLRVLPARGERAAIKLDLRGVGVLSAAMALLVVPLAFGRTAHWAAWTWACLAMCVPVFWLFVLVERRVAAGGRHPVINLDLLTRPLVGWELAGYLARTSSYFAMLFVLAQYLQQGLGKSAAYSGFALIAWVVAFGLAGPAARRLPLRSWENVLGSLIMVSAFLLVSTWHAPGPWLIAVLGLGGLGLGLSFASLLSRLTAAVPPSAAADLSGLLNTTSQVASVAGVAAFGTLYFGFAARPAHAFAVVTLALAGAACVSVACSVAGRRHPIAEARPVPVPAVRVPSGS